ncbi:hybrid sensor histidine kinase/response regulator [Geomonas azotofigens]|uniref:hybrid sensor histidine kinase/response regulator n=1 Tax=Geomonas azotofigens TaxID=2843196 RepID=UPI001C0F8CC7|nr:ATP-binding protein [Geomonas azotofigens]MBU5614359.1 GAF domain-containing protein [Geomonas azotofigens]
MKQINSERKLTPLNISIVYAVVGVLWGAASCLFPAVLAHKSFMYTSVETLNHAFFILATAALLYLLISRSEGDVVRGRESLFRVNRALKTFSGCNQALVRATDELQLMKDVCRTIVETGGYKLAWVGMAEHDDWKTVRPVAQWGDRGGYLTKLDMSWADIDRGRGPTGTAIRTGTTRIAQNIRYDASWTLWREEALKHGFAASISLPLINEGRPLGALVIFAGEKRAFGKQEVKLLEQLADDLSFGIATLRMNVERKKAEQEIMLLASVIEQSKEGLILFDSDGLIQYVNPAIETITGHDAQCVVGRNVAALGDGDGGVELYRFVWADLTKGERRTGGHFIQKGKDGECYEIDITFWSISDTDGAVKNHAALVRDVTHELQLERQLRQAQRMEAIATLAGGIAHDFNNNLASIITCTEMARDDVPLESPLRELLDVVLKSSYRGRKLVKQILTFCCKGEQERQPVQVESIMSECLNLMRPSIPSSITVHAHLEPDLGMIMADPTQIHQIIMNLVTNASHAMRLKGGTLELALENANLDADSLGAPDLPPGPYLKLTVKDSGHGMDQKTMEQIFDPFFTTKGHNEGTGLGLSVVHGIVRNHGGGITVSSRPGLGATFEVFLPRTAAVQKDCLLQPEEVSVAGSGRILFVDDEEDVVFAGKKMLERLGYQVVTGRDGMEALEIFRADPGGVDLVITDQTMPRMTGIELSRELVAVRSDLPVILCTGLGSGVDRTAQREEAEQAGVREVAYKPLDREEMTAMIHRVMAPAGEA